MPEFEPIFARYSIAVVSETDLVENGVHKVARSVADEGTPCAVGTVSSRSKPKNEDWGARIAEARNRLRPVRMFEVGAALYLSETAAVGA